LNRDDTFRGVRAAESAKRERRSARAHAIFRLLMVLVALCLFLRTSYFATLATEQLFRIFTGALK
jgi:hypothetical protein